MKKDSKRHLTIASTLERALSKILHLLSITPERLTVSQVILNSDLSVAEVFVYPLNINFQDYDFILKSLGDNKALIIKRLKEEVYLKYLPTLVFRIDSGYHNMVKVSELLQGD